VNGSTDYIIHDFLRLPEFFPEFFILPQVRNLFEFWWPKTEEGYQERVKAINSILKTLKSTADVAIIK
jgi:hypothetical protein